MGNMRVSRDAGTVAAAREAKQCSPLAKAAKKAGSNASRGEDAPKPERLSRVLATRLHNFPDREWFLPGRHFFMVPPGEMGSPFLSAAPAVPAPCDWLTKLRAARSVGPGIRYWRYAGEPHSG